MILSTSDFVGVYKISTDNFGGLQDYINLIEPEYIRKVLGAENASIINALNPPFPTKYDNLINSVTYTNTYEDVKYNKGLKSALLAFVYFHYVRDNFTPTSTGNVSQNNENSVPLPTAINSQFAITRFNTGVMLIVSDIIPFLTNYNTIIETSTNSTEISGEYTVYIPSTKYLATNDYVNIDGIEYKVTQVTTDTSIKFTTTTGLYFSNKNVIWYPFFQHNGNKIRIITI